MNVSVIGCKDIKNYSYVLNIMIEVISRSGEVLEIVNLPSKTEGFDRLVYRVARDNRIPVARHETFPWYSEGEVYMDMIRNSHNVIFIWDGKDETIRGLLEFAKRREKKVFNHTYVDRTPYEG